MDWQRIPVFFNLLCVTNFIVALQGLMETLASHSERDHTILLHRGPTQMCPLSQHFLVLLIAWPLCMVDMSPEQFLITPSALILPQDLGLPPTLLRSPMSLVSLAIHLLPLATHLLPLQQHQVHHHFMLKLLHLQDIWGMWLQDLVVVLGVEG